MRRVKWSNIVLFWGPALIIYSLFRIYPLFSGLVLGFTDWNGFSSTYNFVGFDNFVQIFKDRLMKTAATNTLIFTFWTVVVQNVLALTFAILLDRKGVGATLFKSVIFFPVLMSATVVGYVWSTILNPVIGMWKPIMSSLGLEQLASLDLLGNKSTALGVIIFVKIWQWTGYLMVIYLAGLQTIPTELREAADIDGAGSFVRLFRITLPLLASSITINVIISTIGSLKQFDHVYVMTGGGPGWATQVVGTAIYSVAFSSYRYGYGIAIAILLFIVVVLITLLQMALLKRKEVTY